MLASVLGTAACGLAFVAAFRGGMAVLATRSSNSEYVLVAFILLLFALGATRAVFAVWRRPGRLPQGLREAILTPGGAFVVLCLGLAPALEVVMPLGEPLGLAFFAAPPVRLWLGVGLAVVVCTWCGSAELVTLSRFDASVASWYLCNGFFFNSMMDVFAGQFQSWQTMTARYNELEPRYAEAGSYAGATVLLTSWQEILIQTPCGLALFFAYWRGAAWRMPVEIVFNMWSVAGVWYFYFSEPVLAFPFVHSPFVKDAAGGGVAFDGAKAWTLETAYKFWIGFVAFPLLWFVVGLWLTFRACRQLSQIVASSSPSSSSAKKKRR